MTQFGVNLQFAKYNQGVLNDFAKQARAALPVAYPHLPPVPWSRFRSSWSSIINFAHGSPLRDLFLLHDSLWSGLFRLGRDHRGRGRGLRPHLTLGVSVRLCMQRLYPSDYMGDSLAIFLGGLFPSGRVGVHASFAIEHEHMLFQSMTRRGL